MHCLIPRETYSQRLILLLRNQEMEDDHIDCIGERSSRLIMNVEHIPLDVSCSSTTDLANLRLASFLTFKAQFHLQTTCFEIDPTEWQAGHGSTRELLGTTTKDCISSLQTSLVSPLHLSSRLHEYTDQERTRLCRLMCPGQPFHFSCCELITCIIRFRAAL